MDANGKMNGSFYLLPKGAKIDPSLLDPELPSYRHSMGQRMLASVTIGQNFDIDKFSEVNRVMKEHWNQAQVSSPLHHHHHHHHQRHPHRKNSTRSSNLTPDSDGPRKEMVLYSLESPKTSADATESEKKDIPLRKVRQMSPLLLDIPTNSDAVPPPPPSLSLEDNLIPEYFRDEDLLD